MILKFSQCDADIIASAQQDKQFQNRWFSLHGEFPDDGNGHHWNMSEYGLSMREL